MLTGYRQIAQEHHRLRGERLTTSWTRLQRHARLPRVQHALSIYIFDPDCPGWTHGRACAAAYARFRLQVKRRSYFPIGPAPDEADRRCADQITTDTHTQAAQDAQFIGHRVRHEAR